jgi:methylmalonyl-CoA/ethylmalonyl-CoA epimerase
MKLEHIGIAVKSLDRSDDLFSRLLGKENYKQESVEREGVKTSFYQVGESKIELLEATNHESAI